MATFAFTFAAFAIAAFALALGQAFRRPAVHSGCAAARRLGPGKITCGNCADCPHAANGEEHP